MAKTVIFFILMATLVNSCRGVYTQDSCEELSMKAYKGFPQAAHKLKKYCSNYQLKYSSDTCQKALVQLTMGTNEKLLKESFGAKIMGCFTKNDLRNFLKK